MTVVSSSDEHGFIPSDRYDLPAIYDTTAEWEVCFQATVDWSSRDRTLKVCGLPRDHPIHVVRDLEGRVVGQ